MRIVVLVLLAGFLAWQGWRGLREQPVAWISSGLVLVALLGLGWMEWRWQRTEQAANVGTAVIAGEDSAGAQCMRFTQALLYARGFAGYVDFDRDGEASAAQLTYPICQDLRSWLESDKQNPTREQVVAVHVVSHEAAHVAGERDEATAECIAMKFDAAVAMAMGASEDQALRLASLYRAEVYPTMPQKYRGNPDRC